MAFFCLLQKIITPRTNAATIDPNIKESVGFDILLIIVEGRTLDLPTIVLLNSLILLDIFSFSSSILFKFSFKILFLF